MKSRKFRLNSLGIISMVVTVFLMILLAPVQMGGKVGYVVVSGDSMEPTYQKGDLVLTRKADEYEVGDITAYDNKILGGTVIHRVVDKVFDRYVLQGDNNDFLDRYQPVADEVIGKTWLHLPKWGYYILELRQPQNFTFVMVVFFAFILFPTGDERQQKKKKSAPKDINRGGIMSSKEKNQELIASLFVLGALALVVLVISFSNPVTELVNETSSFEHQGVFSYQAEAVSGVYDGTMAETGAPLFFNASDSMEIEFEYLLNGYPLRDIEGTYRLIAIARGSNGWTRTVEIVPETEFSELPLTFSGNLVFEDVLKIIQEFERLTDIRADPYQVLIVPEINYSGKYRTQEVAFEFSPNLQFEITDKSLELVFNDNEHLRPKDIAVTTIEIEKSGTLNFLSVEIPVQTIRFVSIAVVLVSGGAIAWLFVQEGKINEAGGEAAIKYAYGDLIAGVSRKPLNKEMTLVDSLEELITIARQTGQVVFSNRRGKFTYYFIQSGGSYYYYRLDNPVVREDEGDLESDSEREKEL